MKYKYLVVSAVFTLLAFGYTSAQDSPDSAKAETVLPKDQPGQNISPEQVVEQPSQQAANPKKTNPSAKAQISAPSLQNKISLDIKGMDIIDVLKMLAVRSGMNIVVGKNVTGRVTLFLKDVDVWDAFEIILLANDLAYEKKGSIINIMSQRDYELLYGERYKDRKEVKIIQLKYAKAPDLSRALNQIKTNVGRIIVDDASNTLVIIDMPAQIKEMEDFIKRTDLLLETQVFSLNYAQAEKLSPKIQEVITKGVGSMRIDERTNKIIVTDYPDKIKEITKIITAFDEKTPQVTIDAQIVEVTPKDEYSMGVNWDVWLEKNVRLMGNFAGPATSSISSFPGRLAYGVAAADPNAGAVTKVGDTKTVLDMLRVIGETKILSSPRITALNNQEAKILVGTKEAYITSTTSQTGTGSTVTAQSVNFVDVGIKLYVTPTINKAGFITMKIKPEISSSTSTTLTSDDKKTDIPIVTTSETETTIMVKDGSTIIIAGLKKDKKVEEVRKIPFFGDIPLLKVAFSNKKSESTKSELVIFITPHISSGENPVEYTSLTKDKDIARIQIQAESIKKPNLVSESQNAQDYRKFVFDMITVSSKAMQTQGATALKGLAEVAFTLNANGQLKDEPRVISSTNPDLNKMVIECVKDAAPFPAFPASFKKDEAEFKITLNYE